MRARLAADSGLENYDAAQWTDWVPKTSLVRNDCGIGSLYQRVPGGPIDTNHVIVPANDRHVLLIWPKGAGEVVGRIAGAGLRSRIAPWCSALIPAGADSEWTGSAQSADHNFHLHFDRDLITHCADAEGLPWHGSPVANCPVVADPGLASLSRWMLGMLRETPEPSRLLWQTGGQAIAFQLVRACAASRAAPKASGRLADWQIRRVSDRMRDDIAEDVALEDLAAAARLSPYHFARAFKASTGMPPHRYQMALRLEEACRLLTTTTQTVGEIALAVGYRDQGGLNRLFNAFLGVTPGAYRRSRP